MKNLEDRIKEYDIKLNNYIDHKDFVKVNRTVKEGYGDISGFILKISKKFILIQKELEFYLNGYSIIRKDSFDSIRHNKFDVAFKKMLIAEGIFEASYGIENDITLETWNSIFTDLKKLDYHVIVECQNLDNPTFTIGPIKRINKSSVSIQNYDPTGLLDSYNTIIDYEDITVVSFNDRYLNVFRKYLRERKKNK